MSEANPFIDLYSDVQFLPDWYVDEKRRRRVRNSQYVIAGVMVVGMIYAWGTTRHYVEGLKTYRHALTQQIDASEASVAKVTELRIIRDDLTRQVTLHRKLRQSINYSQVSGMLAQFTPEQVALTRLEVSTRHIQRPVDRSRVATAADAPQPKPIVDSFIEMSLEGIAPTDVVVANYVGELATSGLFDEVTMVRSSQYGAGASGDRQFELTLRVPLNRHYRPKDAEEVADAR